MRAGSTDLAILLLLALVWGSSYILIKRALVVFTPLEVGALRLGIAAVVLLPFAGRRLRAVPRRRWPWLFLVGLTGTALTSYLFPLAQTRLSSSLTGMLSGLTPLCTLILATLLFRRRPGRRQVAGIALGLLGALGLAWFAPLEGGVADGAIGLGTQLAYAGVVVVCCLCYGLSGNLVAERFADLPSRTVSIGSFFMAGLLGVPYCLAGFDVAERITAAGAAGWWALGYVGVLSIVSTVLCYMLFVNLLQRTGAVFASTVSYLIPVVALGWGLLDREALAWQQLPAVGLVLVGVFLTKRR